MAYPGLANVISEALISTYLRDEHHAIKLPSRWNLNNFPSSVLWPPPSSRPDIRLAARNRRSTFPHIYKSLRQFLEELA